MKPECIVTANLVQKVAIWKSKHNRSERLKEHIRMLDWVLTEGKIRDIEEIINDYSD